MVGCKGGNPDDVMGVGTLPADDVDDPNAPELNEEAGIGLAFNLVDVVVVVVDVLGLSDVPVVFADKDLGDTEAGVVIGNEMPVLLIPKLKLGKADAKLPSLLFAIAVEGVSFNHPSSSHRSVTPVTPTVGTTDPEDPIPEPFPLTSASKSTSPPPSPLLCPTPPKEQAFSAAALAAAKLAVCASMRCTSRRCLVCSASTRAPRVLITLLKPNWQCQWIIRGSLTMI